MNHTKCGKSQLVLQVQLYNAKASHPFNTRDLPKYACTCSNLAHVNTTFSIMIYSHNHDSLSRLASFS